MVDGIRERGRYYNIIIEALLDYDEWMKDDDYNSTTALNKIMKRMRERLEMSDPPPRLEVQIIALVGEWQAEAKKHALAALEGDCDVGDDEWCMHRESARIYRKCADQLAASQPATIAQAGRDPVRLAATQVLLTFKNDEAQGYHSRDRQFAITVLEQALAVPSAEPCAFCGSTYAHCLTASSATYCRTSSVASAQLGCGDPYCKDPNCEYGQERHCSFCNVPMLSAECCESEFEAKGCPHSSTHRATPHRTMSQFVTVADYEADRAKADAPDVSTLVPRPRE